MDFTNRGQQFQPKTDNENKQHVSTPGSHSGGDNGRRGFSLHHRSKFMRIFQAGLLLCVAVLLVGILLSVATFKNNREDDYVDPNKYQAVFLNGGQVYFGKITSLNKEYLVLSNIYYLRVTQQVQPGQENQQNNFTLAKLGCELHRPQDVMVVSKDQVIFWENLKDEEGENTVTGAIKRYAETTNGEQNCEQQSSGSGASSEAANSSNGNNANGSTNNNTTTNNTNNATADDNPTSTNADDNSTNNTAN